MFTKRTLTLLGWFFCFASRCKFFPYEWDMKRETLRLTSSKWHRVTWFLLALYICIMGTFMTLNLAMGILTGALTPASICVDFDLGFFWILMACLHLNMLIRPTAFAAYINQLFQVNRALKREYFDHKIKRRFRDHCEDLIAVLAPSSFSGSLCYCYLFLQEPDAGRYFYRFLPYNNLTSYLLFALWEFYILLSGWVLFYVYMFLFMLHCHSLAFWAKEMTPLNSLKSRIKGQEETWTISTLRNVDSSLRTYRQLQVLSRLWPAIGSIFTPGVQLFSIANHADMIYICVKLHSVMPPVALGGFALVLVVWFLFEILLYPCAGDVQYYAMEYTREVKRHIGLVPVTTHQQSNLNNSALFKKMWLRKFTGSLAPLGIPVAHFYVMSRHSCLLIISYVLYLTLNVLLTF